MHYLQVRSEHEPDDKHEGFGFHVGLLGLTQWQGGAKEQMYSGRLALGVSSRSHVARRELRTSAIISLQPGRLISCQPPASQTQITKVKVAPSFPYGVAVGTNQRRALGFAVGGAVRPQHDIRRPGLAQVLAQARCADPFVPAAAGINRGDERIARGRRPGGLEPRRPPMRGRGREIPGPVTIKLRPAVLISASAVSTTSPARPRSTSRRASRHRRQLDGGGGHQLELGHHTRNRCAVSGHGLRQGVRAVIPRIRCGVKLQSVERRRKGANSCHWLPGSITESLSSLG